MVTAIAFMMYPVTDMSRRRFFLYEEALGVKPASSPSSHPSGGWPSCSTPKATR